MGRLDGRVAIVTGGAKGIGRHYSLALAAEGARLMIADIADGADVADTIARAHGDNSVASAKTDVSDETSVKTLVAQTMDRFGRIDILVNNAAVYATLHEEKFTDIDVATWDRAIAVNLRGPFLMVKYVGPQMHGAGLRQDHQHRLRHGVQGHSHDAALRDFERRHHGVYACAVTGARRARHSGQHACRPVLRISDTVVAENPQACGDRWQAFGGGQGNPLRDAHPQDLLGALVFLASADSDFITGQTLAVDGGNVNT